MKTFLVLFLGIIGISAYAQGIWIGDTIQPNISASTEIPFGITGLTGMHSDPIPVFGKLNEMEIPVEYHDVIWDTDGCLNGSTNGMYYAFRPAKEGTLDIFVRMTGGKPTFILELTDDCPDNADLAALTTNIQTGDGITGTASYFTTPLVYDTDSETEKTWDGTVAPVTENTMMVFSWSVTADKTYVAGCFGSKIKLKGVNYICEPSGLDNLNTVQSPYIFPNPAAGNVIVKMDKSTKIGIYNSVGLLLKQQLVTSSDNNVDISGLEPGMYCIKDMNSKNQVQKLIVK